MAHGHPVRPRTSAPSRASALAPLTVPAPPPPAARRLVEPAEIIQFFLHLADLGNCVIDWDASKRWAHRVCEETIAQLGREKALNLPVPPQTKMDAYTDPEVAARQLVFLDGWVRV